MNEVLMGLLFTGFFIAGFFIGKNTDRIEQTLYSVPEALKRAGFREPQQLKRIGAIPTPTQQEIYLRDNPKIKEEAEEMSKVFDSLQVDKVTK